MKIDNEVLVLIIFTLALNVSCGITYMILPDAVNKHLVFFYVNLISAGVSVFTLIYTAFKVK